MGRQLCQIIYFIYLFILSFKQILKNKKKKEAIVHHPTLEIKMFHHYCNLSCQNNCLPLNNLPQLIVYHLNMVNIIQLPSPNFSSSTRLFTVWEQTPLNLDSHIGHLSVLTILQVPIRIPAISAAVSHYEQKQSLKRHFEQQQLYY